MIDIKIAKKKFLEYAEKFGQEDKSINRKRAHSLRVMKISKEIAESLCLTQDEIELATLIGLLHDIGRFLQAQTYKSFNDETTVDHGDLGVEILKENNYIEEYCKDKKWQEIIEKAIRNHSKFAIEQGLTEKEMLFAKIIRDADKIDIMFEGTCILERGRESQIEKLEIRKQIKDMVMEESLLNHKVFPEINDLENFVNRLAFVFDIHFTYSFQKIEKEQYVNKIVDRFDYQDAKTRTYIKEIQEKVNTYVEERCK